MSHRSIKKITSFLSFLVVMLFASTAFAQSKEELIADDAGQIAIAAAFGLGIAALGGGLGQGRAAAAALDGIARNPGAADKIRGPMILALALIESLVIYALIVAFLLFGKI
jgi:F-type H+-transporting ATPase subunit c